MSNLKRVRIEGGTVLIGTVRRPKCRPGRERVHITTEDGKVHIFPPSAIIDVDPVKEPPPVARRSEAASPDESTTENSTAGRMPEPQLESPIP